MRIFLPLFRSSNSSKFLFSSICTSKYLKTMAYFAIYFLYHINIIEICKVGKGVKPGILLRELAVIKFRVSSVRLKQPAVVSLLDNISVLHYQNEV